MNPDHHLRYAQPMATEAQIRAALPHLPFSGMTAAHVEAALNAADWAREAEATDPRLLPIIETDDAGNNTGGELVGEVREFEPTWANYGAVNEIISQEKVTRVTVNTWRGKPGFPPPVATYGGQDIYDLRAVREWREAGKTEASNAAVEA